MVNILGTNLRLAGFHQAERAVLVMKEEFVSNGKERGKTRGQNPKIMASHEINSSIDSMVLLSQAQCFGKHSVAFPGGLGLGGSETVWVSEKC